MLMHQKNCSIVLELYDIIALSHCVEAVWHYCNILLELYDLIPLYINGSIVLEMYDMNVILLVNCIFDCLSYTTFIFGNI